MNPISQQLKSFRRRVRLVRAWRGLAIGLCVGGLLGALWSVLDLMGKFYTEWSWLAALAGGCALVGAIAGMYLKVPESALNQSIDRRAGLKDRLTTAGEGDAFEGALQRDASSHLQSLKPAQVFPIKVGRWQGGAVALSALAAAIFLLGNTPLLLSDAQKKQAEQLKAEGAKVERVIRETLEDPKLANKMTDREKKMAEDLLKLKKDIDKNRLTKEEALQRANEIAKEAQKLMNERVKNVQESLKNGDTALDSLRKQAMEQVGMKSSNADMMKMSDSQREAAMQQAKQEINQLQNQINSLNNQMQQLQQKLSNPNLSAEERKKLEDQKKALEKALADAKKSLQDAKDNLESLQLSKEAQAVFQKMMKNPLYKKLQELAQKLAENAAQAQQSGQPKLTKEQLEEIRKEMEALAEKLKDDKEMDKYLQALIDAMEQSDQMGLTGLPAGLGIPIPVPMPGRGAATEDTYMGDSGVINKLDKEEAGRGKTNATMVSGSKRETGGQDAYIEIKAPTTVGNRSSIPYVKVLPSYKKKEESALERQEIPKEHEKRVKEYFESLNGK